MLHVCFRHRLGRIQEVPCRKMGLEQSAGRGPQGTSLSHITTAHQPIPYVICTTGPTDPSSGLSKSLGQWITAKFRLCGVALQ